jgi:alpha-L-rhamnosidase
MTKIANLLNKNEDESFFSDLSIKIRKEYNDKYFNKITKNYNDGSQMANAFPLYLKIVPDKYRKDVLDNLVTDILEKQGGHLTTGVLGTKYMIDALSGEDRSDVAWTIVTQTGYPSWSDMMEKYTTICEFWTLKQSHNHVMMGSIDAWFYKTLAGIQIDEKHPAFENIIVKPYLAKDLTYASASVETIRGAVSSEWEINDSGLKLNVRIPFNTTAEIYIPAWEGAEIFESGKPAKQSESMKFSGYEKNYHIFSVESGKYNITVAR